MVSTRRVSWGWMVGLVGVLLVGWGPGLARAARPSAARLLPEKTILLLSVPDVRELARRFLNTSLGRIGRDPQMQPLVKNVYGRASEAVERGRQVLGVSLGDMLAMPQGEFAFAVVAQDDEPIAVVLLLDTGNEVAKARTLLANVAKAAEGSGAKKSEETVAGATLKIYEGLPGLPTLALVEKDGTVVVGNSVGVLRGILEVWNGGKVRSLAQNPKYSEAISYCRGKKGEEPQAFFYVDPIGFFKASAQGNAGMQMGLMMLPTLGLDGLQALAASVAMDTPEFDTIFHGHVLLDRPRAGVLDLIALESGDTTPEPWVPNDVVRYVTLRWKFEKTYKGLAKLIDSFQGEGAFAKQVGNNIRQATGLDLAKEVLPQLDGRLTYLTWIERPITPTSQATLVAVGLKDPVAAGKLFDSVVAKHSQAMTLATASGKTYYRIGPRIERPASDAPWQPRPCVGILENSLVFTDRPALYEKVLATAARPEESLGKSLDFKVVASQIARRGGAKPGMFSFARPEEAMRFFYELVTSEASRQPGPYGMRNPVLQAARSAIESSPLPPFAAIERYLAPGGGTLTDDEGGLHFSSFNMKRK